MTTRRLISLPIEIKHCILTHLPRPPFFATPLPSSLPSRLRSSSTYSVLPTRPFDSIPTLDPSAATREAPEEAIFESPLSAEYSSIPPSSLDSPSLSPRSPTDSLLSLLRSKDYSTALSLLQELESTQVHIEKRYEFAQFAEQVFLLGGEKGKDWLKWWELTPGLVQGERVEVERTERLRKLDRRYFQLATKLSRGLVQKLEDSLVEMTEAQEEGEGGKKMELLNEMRLFGEMLASKGQTRIIAEEFIFEMALDGREVGMALELWEYSLSELIRQKNEFGVPGEGEAEEFRSMKEWFDSKNRESFKVLVRAREAIIKALTNLGQVDQAIEILLSTRQYPSFVSPRRPLELGKNTYLVILAQLGTQDRFDLFEKVFKQFELEGNKLVRIQNEKMKSWSPYFARSSTYHDSSTAGSAQEGGGGNPSAQEAFTTFRDQHAVSSIEEGSLSLPPELPVEWKEYSKLTGEDSEYYGRTTSQTESQLLVRLVESSQLSLALEKLVQLLTKGPLPSAHSVSTLIHSLESHDNGAVVLKTIENLVRNSYWQRGFWVTCRMLADLEKGELKLVVRRFRDHFNLKGLPLALIAGIKGATLRTVSTRRNESNETAGGGGGRLETTTCNAYTLSIVMQALVPLFTTSHPTSGGSQHLRRIFTSLFDPMAWQIVPSHKKQQISRSSLAVEPSRKSPLDPYTFIPFLLLTLENSRSPTSTSTSTSDSVCEQLLDILQSMQSLGIKPELPHLSLLLSAYAKKSARLGGGGDHDLDEFRFLLSSLEHQTLPSEIPSSVSPNLVDFIRTQFPSSAVASSAPDSFSPRFYATLLKSLRLRQLGSPRDKEQSKKEAMMILQRLMERVGVEGLRAMLESREGEGLRAEVGRLGTKRKEEQ
ncbi:uncharacterized protein JCM6883_007074 [Sporobolomyces salmoneus]|uniref:uncharacterized protein n=1 Tax=Sporobolomyces salmoneus TaxID=183962 RepID=UPI0031751623